jgi:hypothetical protein
MRLRDLLLCVLFVAGLALRAEASLMLYTDAEVFAAAAGETRLIDFNSGERIIDHSNSTQRVTFDDIAVFSSDAHGGSLWSFSEGEGNLVLGGHGGTLAILVPVTGFGFDVSAGFQSLIRIWGVGDPYHEIGQPSIGYDVPEGTTFFGVLFDAPTMISISSDVSNAPGVAGYAMDNLRIRTPEPSTLLLLGLGLCAVARRRVNSNAE